MTGRSCIYLGERIIKKFVFASEGAIKGKCHLQGCRMLDSLDNRYNIVYYEMLFKD